MPGIGLTSELEAINIMLAATATAPISSLPGNGNDTADALLAQNTLNLVRKEVCTRGWHWNTDQDVPFLPNAVTSLVQVPPSTISADGSRGTRFKPRLRHPRKDLTVRFEADGSKVMYDRELRTKIFTETLFLDLTFIYEFDKIPEQARRFIMMKAARLFKGQVDDEPTRNASIEEQDAWLDLNRLEEESGEYNILTGSFGVRRITARRNPFTRMRN